MPRDGSGTYAYPPGTPGAPNTPISSTTYNAFLADLASVLNSAAPTLAGGTGGNSEITGWDGLATKGTDIASSSSINLQTATGPSLTITGTASISTVTLDDGKIRFVRAGGAFTLIASASLLVNGSAASNLTVVAEDLLLFRGQAGGVVSVARIGSAAPSSNITGSVGVTDNRIVRSDGTGGQTVQGSDASLDDSGNLGIATLTTTGAIELGHATDTTVARAAAGFVSVEGKRVPSPASQASGDLLYRGGTEWERLAKGTALQRLRMNAGATAPEWADDSGMPLLETLSTASGATVTSTASFIGYRGLYIEFDAVSGTSNGSLDIQTSTTGAAWGTASNLFNFNAADAAYGHMYLMDLQLATQGRWITGSANSPASGAAAAIGVANAANAAGAITNIRFDPPGNFDGGAIRIYGIW